MIALRKFLPLFLLSLFAFGCASSTSPDTSNIRFQAEMTTTQVSGTMAKGGAIQTGTITSIQITSMRFLISEIKLEAKTSASEIKVKDNAALLTVDATGSRLTSVATIPAGIYTKASIKFHPLDDDERTQLMGDPNFQDFIANDRYSVIINGTITENGQTVPFQLNGKINETLNLDMADVSVDQSGITTIAIQADPVLIFKDHGSQVILDPRDSKNQSFFEGTIKSSLKALKK